MSTSDSQPLPEFSDGPPMPPMCEAVLSDDDLARLFEDLAACTSILSVQEKGSVEAYAQTGPAGLSSAQSRLLSGTVRGLQIRYAYQDHDWTDTLIRLPNGTRLVRCQHPDEVGIPSRAPAPDGGA
ncbi:MAG TPA: hypothetical protein EYG03_01935 [Planctomycetes bacterium]|nr:hypothetical protein [Fuerstiella sp.]HIK90739.1 hypothetical protein [Planctomycetota bacterium]